MITSTSSGRWFIGLIIFSLFFATACQRHDDVVPSVGVPVNTSLRAMIATEAEALVIPENPTGTFRITPEGVTAPPPTISATMAQTLMQTLGSSKNLAKGAMVTTSGSLVENLALAAMTGASGVWWWDYAKWGHQHVNDGNVSTFWASQFWEYYSWVSLTWPIPVTMGKIHLSSYEYPPGGGFLTAGHAEYWNGSAWVSISGTDFVTTLYPNLGIAPNEFTAEFPPITATAIRLYTHSLNHPNYASLMGEFEVYEPEPSLKITGPASGSSFDLGQTVSFSGSKTGNITSIEWFSSIDGIFAKDTLSLSKANLSPGVHTIRLQGIVSTPVGDQHPSDSITITISGGKPRVTKMEFLSMSSGDNRNRIYDRKQEYKNTGDKFLEPFQWEGEIANNEVITKAGFPFPVSYVRSGSGFGISKIRLKAYFMDLANSPSLTFTANLSASISGQPLAFVPKTVTTTGGAETVVEFETTNGVPETVGIWELAFNWSFSMNGSNVGFQQIPGQGLTQSLFTTWSKPREDGNFFVGEKTVGNYWLAEEVPTRYLEVFHLSCLFASGVGNSDTEEIITTQIYDRLWLGNVYSFIKKDPDLLERRGIDRILDYKNGWCGELAHLLQALVEIQGINVKTRNYQIKQEFLMGDVCHLVSDLEDIPAAGQVLPKQLIPPKENRWIFLDHTAVILESNGMVFNPTFHQKNLSFEGYVNDLFNVCYLSFPLTQSSVWNVKSPNPMPDFVDVIDSK